MERFTEETIMLVLLFLSRWVLTLYFQFCEIQTF